MKYILKKEYPGSPKLGYIDDLNKSGHNNQGEYVQSMYDKNPEFWEKVVGYNNSIAKIKTIDLVKSKKKKKKLYSKSKKDHGAKPSTSTN